MNDDNNRGDTARDASQTLTTRRAPLSKGSFNPETRTFQAVAATATPVKRSDPWTGESYGEVLSMDAKAIRLDRLNSGRAPFLNSHRTGSLSDQIGVVKSARIEGGQLVVDVELSARDDVAPIAADIAAGITKNISVGYRVHASEEQRAKDGSRTITHTSWEPFEVSLVTIPADSSAFIRSQEGIFKMENQTIPALDPNEAQRIAQITDIAKRTGIDAIETETAIGDGVSVADFRARALEVLAARSDATAINGRLPHNEQTLDNPAFLARSIEGALYARMSGKAPEGAAREYAGKTLLEMGVEMLRARGERTSWANRDQLAGRVMARVYSATSDFPTLLTSSGNRILLDAYGAVQTPLKAIGRKRTATDFRSITGVRLSEAPKLLEVAENGTVTAGEMSEVKETFSVKTYARLFNLTRQAIINDDLAAFADINRAWGRAAAETEADVLVALLTANTGAGATMDDGKALYHIDHGNLAASGSAIDTAGLSAARKALRDMKGLDGVTPMSVAARHILVGSAKETEAEQAVAQINASQIDQANPFANKLAVHVEPRLTGNSWRVFADPAEMPVIEYAYLSGQEGPQLSTREGWEVLGMEFRCVLDFGAGLSPHAHAGTFKNPGA